MSDTGSADHHPYLAGLVLVGRKVVVVGGGHVAQRRVPTFLAAGAAVTLVSPEVTPALEGLAGELTLVLRDFTESDLDGAWYVVAATDDPEVNARVAAAAESRHTFCVRSRRRPAAGPRGRPRSATTAASPSACSATASRASRPRCATTSSPPCATAT